MSIRGVSLFSGGLGSVRLRLTFWSVGVLALVLGIFGTVLWYSARAHLLTEIDRELMVRGHRFQGRWEHEQGEGRERREGDRNDGHRPPDGRGPADFVPGPGDRFRLRPRLLGLPGQTNAGSTNDVPWDPKAWAVAARGHEAHSTVLDSGDPMRIFSAPLVQSHQVRGVLQMAAPLDGVNRDLNGLSWTLLTLIPVALLVAGIGGAFLTERALRPIRAITQAAGQIEARDLSQRLPVTGQDEFSRLALTFNGMLARLERAFEQQQRFAADASHELRSPLTLIQGYTSMALSRPRTAAEYRGALEATDRAARRMNVIVQDLLLLARSDAGQLDLNLRPVSLQNVLEQAGEAVPERDLATIETVLTNRCLEVLGDSGQLVRLFTNLLDNAARHTPPERQIIIHAFEEEKRVIVTVQDTGSGIAPEHLPHVMERFYRADAARARREGGTGLGLAICRSIVEAHGGTISIESTLGRGTCVEVSLPSAQPAVRAS